MTHARARRPVLRRKLFPPVESPVWKWGVRSCRGESGCPDARPRRPAPPGRSLLSLVPDKPPASGLTPRGAGGTGGAKWAHSQPQRHLGGGCGRPQSPGGLSRWTDRPERGTDGHQRSTPGRVPGTWGRSKPRLAAPAAPCQPRPSPRPRSQSCENRNELEYIRISTLTKPGPWRKAKPRLRAGSFTRGPVTGPAVQSCGAQLEGSWLGRRSCFVSR